MDYEEDAEEGGAGGRSWDALARVICGHAGEFARQCPEGFRHALNAMRAADYAVQVPPETEVQRGGKGKVAKPKKSSCPVRPNPSDDSSSPPPSGSSGPLLATPPASLLNPTGIFGAPSAAENPHQSYQVPPSIPPASEFLSFPVTPGPSASPAEFLDNLPAASFRMRRPNFTAAERQQLFREVQWELARPEAKSITSICRMLAEREPWLSQGRTPEHLRKVFYKEAATPAVENPCQGREGADFLAAKSEMDTLDDND